MKTVVLVAIARRDPPFFLKIIQKLDKKYNFVILNLYEPGQKIFKKNKIHSVTIKDLKAKYISILNKCPIKYSENEIKNIIRHEALTFNDTNKQKLIKKLSIYTALIYFFFRDLEPDYVIQELGGFIAPLSIFNVCKILFIKHLFIEPMPFKGRLAFLQDCLSYRVPASNVVNCLEVERYIEDYKNNKLVIIPRKDLHHFVNSNFKKILNFENFEKIINKIYNKYVLRRDQEYDAIFNHLKRSIISIINRLGIEKNYFSNLDLDNGKIIIFYPLHVPLDFQLTVRSPDYLDQINFLQGLLNNIPKGAVLWTKEHPVAIGSYGVKKLQNLIKNPNFRLFDPAINSYELIKKSDVVVTINSKVGFEALMQSKPVIVLGQPAYSNQGLTVDLPSVSNINEALLKIFNNRDIFIPCNKKFIQFMSSLYKLSTPGELYDLNSDNINQFSNSLVNALEHSITLKDSE